MKSLRAFISAHRALAASLFAAALLLRVLVPAGFMPITEGGRVVVGLCNASGASTMVIAVPGLEHDAGDRAAGSCAFADLAMPSMAGADPILLAAFVAFITTLAALFATASAPRASFRLRPPLRGPPAHA